MHEFDITADELVSALLSLAATETVCILDSCGVGNLGSHLLIAGIEPIEIVEITNNDPAETLSFLDEKLSDDLVSIFTISYNFGLKLFGLVPRIKPIENSPEPDVFLARFDVLIIHDYVTGKTRLAGNANKFVAISRKLDDNISNFRSQISNLNFEISNAPPRLTSNFSKKAYLEAIGEIKELIRRGDTYQTNLTQQLTSILPVGLTPEIIFVRLRRNHPAPFSAFIKRRYSTVVSASPERFFRVRKGENPTGREGGPGREITTSPIKGTQHRGATIKEDETLRNQLLTSKKDRAENTMIVDLLRNDLGRVCEFGSIRVAKLCELETHPTFFHLVSTVTGELRDDAGISDILRAVFPCGSITGAPKINTMRIIDEIETANRGLSMGAIGYYIPKDTFGMPETLDLSVAIRTMVVRGDSATFNVGGGIVIDSDPESEYNETLTKAKALFDAMGVSSEFKL